MKRDSSEWTLDIVSWLMMPLYMVFKKHRSPSVRRWALSISFVMAIPLAPLWGAWVMFVLFPSAVITMIKEA